MHYLPGTWRDRRVTHAAQHLPTPPHLPLPACTDLPSPTHTFACPLPTSYHTLPTLPHTSTTHSLCQQLPHACTCTPSPCLHYGLPHLTFHLPPPYPLPAMATISHPYLPFPLPSHLYPLPPHTPCLATCLCYPIYTPPPPPSNTYLPLHTFKLPSCCLASYLSVLLPPCASPLPLPSVLFPRMVGLVYGTCLSIPMYMQNILSFVCGFKTLFSEHLCARHAKHGSVAFGFVRQVDRDDM